jgi:hypothetical protein
MSRKEIDYSPPASNPEDEAADREKNELAEAAQKAARLGKKAEMKATDEKRQAVLDSIAPHERREAMPMRQISIMCTDEQHQILTARAREARVTTRKLIAAALKPLWTK